MIIILLIIYFSLFSLFKFEISISAIYILILKDFRTVTLRTDTTDTPTHRDASHLKIFGRTNGFEKVPQGMHIAYKV